MIDDDATDQIESPFAAVQTGNFLTDLISRKDGGTKGGQSFKAHMSYYNHCRRMKQANLLSPDPDKPEACINTDLECVLDNPNPEDCKSKRSLSSHRSSLGPSFVSAPRRKSIKTPRARHLKKKPNSQHDCLKFELKEGSDHKHSLAMIKEQTSVSRNSLNNSPLKGRRVSLIVDKIDEGRSCDDLLCDSDN